MPTELPPLRNNNLINEPPEHEPRRTSNSDPAPQPQDTGSFRIATISGIPIRLHLTFLLLLAYFAFRSLSGSVAGVDSTANATRNPSYIGLLYVIGLFTCVILHELGHAIVAKRYGIRTRDIVLYPIGGVAALETQPRPRQELWIALAGPTVNVVIALLCWLGLRLAGLPTEQAGVFGAGANPLAALMWTNLSLAAFNMLPAFPMDGGRVLRAILARNMNEVAATAIAARIGQFLAIAFGLFSLVTGQLLLLLIAAFVYFGAGQEATAFQTQALLEGHRVREAMLREFHTLTGGMTLREASDILLAGSQQDFPVVHGGEVAGVLSRSDLMRGIATDGFDAYVAGTMRREFPTTTPDAELQTVLTDTGTQAGPILVMETGPNGAAGLVGMVTQENLIEFLTLTQLQSLRRREYTLPS